MKHNLNNFFQSNLYISERYLDTLLPVYINSVVNNQASVDSQTIEELEKKCISITSKNVMIGDSTTEEASKVVIINFIGPVIKYADWWYDMLGTQDYIRILDRYKNDPTVAGVVMNVDSGGGQVYGTPEFYDYISDFKKSKPIGIFTNGLLCSGAYYFAAPASFICALKRADAIGSIGMYTMLFDFNGYYESVGLKVHTIYSDLSPEKNKSYRDVMDNKDPGYKNYIKNELNPDTEKFHSDMKSARPQLNDEVLKGGTWNGEEAIGMGLVDFNGTLEDAVNKVYELALEAKNLNNNNNQSKKKTMSKTSKSFPTIQKIAGIEGEGIPVVKTITGKKGIQVEEEQLEKIETALADSATEVQTQKDAVTAEQAKVTKLEGAVAAALTKAGLTAAGTTEANIELLANKVVEYGNHPAIKGSKPGSNGDSFDDDDNAIVNKEDDHNKIYDEA